MIVGLLTERSEGEYRVGLTPGGVAALVKRGHSVLIQKGAGDSAGFTDDLYERAGAELCETREEVWQRPQMIVKVQGPLPDEQEFLRRDLILFCFLHLAANPDLARSLEMFGVSAIGCETIQLDDGTLPILKPMSEIAGKMAVQIGAHLLERPGGRGVLLGGLPGVSRGRVTILGGGVVGRNAAMVASGMGAEVTVLDVNIGRLRQIQDALPDRVQTLHSNEEYLAESVSRAHLLIGAVLRPGAKAPQVVAEEMVRSMKPGCVIVDLSIDQGGCVETIRPTTLREPTFRLHDVIHYGVANVASSVANSAAKALTQASLDSILRLADKGFDQAVKNFPPLHNGVNAYKGHITYEAVAETLGMEYRPLSVLL